MNNEYTPREEHTRVEEYGGFTIVYDQGPASWGAYVENLPTCVAVGETYNECQRLIKEGIVIYLDELRRAGTAAAF